MSTANRIFIGGLDHGIDDYELRDNFKSFGEIEQCIVMKDRETQKSRGYGFISYKDDESAADAIDGMHGTEIKGRSISVKPAERGRRDGGGRGGYRGGRGGGGYDRYNRNGGGGGGGYGGGSYGGGGGGGYRGDRYGSGGGGGRSYNNDYSGGGRDSYNSSRGHGNGNSRYNSSNSQSGGDSYRSRSPTRNYNSSSGDKNDD